MRTFYFKRSQAPERLAHLGEGLRRIHPLGLNYAVYPDRFDAFGLRRAIRFGKGRRRVTEVFRSFSVLDGAVFTPRVHLMEAVPDPGQASRALFMARAHDPYDDPALSQEKIDEKIRINDVWAQCIRALRKELGERFYGGFMHTEYAVKHHRESLVLDRTRSSKGGYIKLLRSFPIGIATRGLCGSTGWKFAEYVAFSKAIVSEPLNYAVTGDLEAGRNDEEFNTVDECVEKATRLLEDRAFREEMMTNDARYYGANLRPDALVMNTLLKAKVVEPPRRMCQCRHRSIAERQDEQHHLPVASSFICTSKKNKCSRHWKERTSHENQSMDPGSDDVPAGIRGVQQQQPGGPERRHQAAPRTDVSPGHSRAHVAHRCAARQIGRTHRGPVR